MNLLIFGWWVVYLPTVYSSSVRGPYGFSRWLKEFRKYNSCLKKVANVILRVFNWFFYFHFYVCALHSLRWVHFQRCSVNVRRYVTSNKTLVFKVFFVTFAANKYAKYTWLYWTSVKVHVYPQGSYRHQEFEDHWFRLLEALFRLPPAQSPIFPKCLNCRNLKAASDPMI